jgi:hypothetical protein
MPEPQPIGNITMPVGGFLLTPLQCLLTHQSLLHVVLQEHHGPSTAIEGSEFILCFVGRPGASEDTFVMLGSSRILAMNRNPVP